MSEMLWANKAKNQSATRSESPDDGCLYFHRRSSILEFSAERGRNTVLHANAKSLSSDSDKTDGVSVVTLAY